MTAEITPEEIQECKTLVKSCGFDIAGIVRDQEGCMSLEDAAVILRKLGQVEKILHGVNE